MSEWRRARRRTISFSLASWSARWYPISPWPPPLFWMMRQESAAAMRADTDAAGLERHAAPCGRTSAVAQQVTSGSMGSRTREVEDAL